jgi:hypothetical protein
MTAPNQTPSKNPSNLLPSDPLPGLSDTADTASLMALLNDSATYYWRCQTAMDKLFQMDAAERQACPNYSNLLNAARLGMAAARQLQERARQRLERLAAFPQKWAAWPERRTVARPDVR